MHAHFHRTPGKLVRKTWIHFSVRLAGRGTISCEPQQRKAGIHRKKAAFFQRHTYVEGECTNRAAAHIPFSGEIYLFAKVTSLKPPGFSLSAGPQPLPVQA